MNPPVSVARTENIGLNPINADPSHRLTRISFAVFFVLGRLVGRRTVRKTWATARSKVASSRNARGRSSSTRTLPLLPRPSPVDVRMVGDWPSSKAAK